MKIKLFLLFFFISSIAFSQNNIEIVKLEKEFKTSKNDTVQLNVLIKLTELNLGSENFMDYYKLTKAFADELIQNRNEPIYTKSVNTKIECEILLSKNFITKNDYNKSIAVLKKILLIPDIDKKKQIYSKILLLISKNYFNLFDNKKALDYANKNAIYSKSNNYIYGLAGSYAMMHNIYAIENNKEKKYEYVYKTIKLYTKLKDDYKLATAYLNLGMYFNEEFEFEKAKKYYKKALPLITNKYTDLEAGAYNSLSYLYTAKKQYKLAMIYANKALENSIKTNDEQSIANARLMIGYLFKIGNDFNQANKNINESLIILRKLKAFQASISAINEMGDNYYRFDSLQKIKRKKLDVTVFPVSLGLQFKTENKLDIALRILKYAEKLNLEYGTYIEKHTNYMYQKKVYLAMADYKNAYKMLELEKLYNDSLVSEDNKKYGVEKELEYNYKNKVTKDSLQLIVHKKNNDLKIATVKATNYKLIFGIIFLCSIGTIMFFRFSYIKKRKEVAIVEQKRIVEQKEKEIIETELNYLKSQINPHFLFNSLNTILFKIAKTNEKAREAVLGFSEILRYQLYDCNLSKVPISKEIKYLQEYIKLQLMRKNDNCICNFENEESVANFDIAPLILITFVENAFKYLRNDKNQKNEINIILKKNNNKFVFEIDNDKNYFEKQSIENSGIGLTNIKRRLELIYTNKYELLINDEPKKFKVRLTISI